MIDAPQDAPNAGQRLTLQLVRDGSGGFRHEFRPAPLTKPKGKKERPAPDPIHANPEASAQQLKQLIERKENMLQEKDALNADIRDLDSEVKALGYDLKAYNAIIALRRTDPVLRADLEAILETYKTALGIE